MKRWSTVDTDWPEFGGGCAPPPPPSVEDLEARIDALRLAMRRRGFTHVLVYGDREHFANLAWLTNFDPRFEEALLVVCHDRLPLIVTGNECRGYLPVSRLWQAARLRHELYQEFSPVDQPRGASRMIGEILRDEGIGPGALVGFAGWKYYADPAAVDAPAYLVDAARALAGADHVLNAADLFIHAGHGLRARASASEIAFLEYSNAKASEGMKRILRALRTGMTDHELLAEARYDGLPLSCHISVKSGPGRISLASPRGSVIERGHRWSANIAYWGSNICRAGWVASSPADLPAAARDYLDAFAGPYFATMGEWLRRLRIGENAGALAEFVLENLPHPRFGIELNPGHLIHFDEWLSSPFYPGSTVAIRSGMIIQTDVIPSSKVYFSTRMEDGVAVADSRLQDELRQHYPDCHARCLARRSFAAETLGIRLAEEILPLSNTFGLVPPFLLRPGLFLSLEG